MFLCGASLVQLNTQYFPCDDSCIHILAFFSPLACRSDSRGQHGETDVLLRALVEAEIDGVAVANQLTALKETIDSLVKVNMAPDGHFVHTGGQENEG